MSIVGTLPANIKNGDAEDANVVMSLFNFIQSQINANAAANGANADITSLGALASINGGPISGHRNRLINGNFAINQLSVSGTVNLSAGAYGHDGWKAGASGCTYTFASSGADTIVTITSGSLIQILEAADIEGGTYTLSNKGTAQARIAVNGAVTSGAYAACPLASAAATGGQSMSVEFSTGTIDRAQLEVGTVATTFERRKRALELALCQRYYEIVHVSAVGVAAVAGAQWGSGFNFKVTKYQAPGVNGLITNVSVNVSSSTSDSIDTTGFRYYITAAAAGAFAADGLAAAVCRL